jgi:hypothetical protein
MVNLGSIPSHGQFKSQKMKKQTAVKLILDKFNLLSDADFKSWILNHHDELIQIEQQQIIDAFYAGSFQISEKEYEYRTNCAMNYLRQFEKNGGQDER